MRYTFRHKRNKIRKTKKKGGWIPDDDVRIGWTDSRKSSSFEFYYGFRGDNNGELKEMIRSYADNVIDSIKKYEDSLATLATLETLIQISPPELVKAKAAEAKTQAKTAAADAVIKMILYKRASLTLFFIEDMAVASETLPAFSSSSKMTRTFDQLKVSENEEVANKVYTLFNEQLTVKRPPPSDNKAMLHFFKTMLDMNLDFSKTQVLEVAERKGYFGRKSYDVFYTNLFITVYNNKNIERTQLNHDIDTFYSRIGIVSGETGLRPLDYDDKDKFSSQIYRSFKFMGQRLFDLGIGTDPGVNRLFFKNEEYKDFVDPAWLSTTKYEPPNEEKWREWYGGKSDIPQESTSTEGQGDDKEHWFRKGKPLTIGTFVRVVNSSSLVSATTRPIFEGRIKKVIDKDLFKPQSSESSSSNNESNVKPSVKCLKQIKVYDGESRGVGLYSENYGYISAKKSARTVCETFYKLEYPNKFDGKWVEYKYPVPESAIRIIYKPSFFEFNDEVNVPFANPYFFEFLHMFKYTMSKAFSKFRFYRVYRILDGLKDQMANTYFQDPPSPPSPPSSDGESLSKDTIFKDTIFYKNTYLYALRRTFTDVAEAAIHEENTGLGNALYKQGFGLRPLLLFLKGIFEYAVLKPLATVAEGAQRAGFEVTSGIAKQIDAERVENKGNFSEQSKFDLERDNEGFTYIEEGLSKETGKVSSEGEENLGLIPGNQDTPRVGGGKKKYKTNRRILKPKRKTKGRISKKSVGGGLSSLYFNRVYRILNMHIDTSNLYLASKYYDDNSSSQKTNAEQEQYQADIQLIESVPQYLIKEQLNFLLLAYTFFAYSHEPNNRYCETIVELTYKKYKTVSLFGLSVGTPNIIQVFMVTIFNSLVEQYSESELPSESKLPTKTLYSMVCIDLIKSITNYLDDGSNIVNTQYTSLLTGKSTRLPTNYGYLKELFTLSADMMFHEFTDRLFKDPSKTSIIKKPNSDNITKYYDLKGIMEKSFPFDKTKKAAADAADTTAVTIEKYKVDTVNFLRRFVFSLTFTPHFACSQLMGFAIGGLLNAPSHTLNVGGQAVNFAGVQLADLIKDSIIHTAGSNIGQLLDPVKYVGNVAGGIGQGISSLLNTPNCYYAMAMMFYVMFFRIRPLQPHEGGYLGDYDYQEKSTILDTGIMYTHRDKTANAKRYVKSVVQDVRTNPFKMKVVNPKEKEEEEDFNKEEGEEEEGDFNKKEGDFNKYRIRTKALTHEKAQLYGRDSDTISTGSERLSNDSTNSERLSNDSTTGYQQLSTIQEGII